MDAWVNQTQNGRRIQPRATIPEVCYDTCNNANIEAQHVGKSPELCNPDSDFMTYYNACSGCVKAQTDDPQVTKDYLDPAFSQYLDYCKSPENSTTAGGSTLTGGPPATVSSTALTVVTVLITIPYTATIGGITTVWPLTKTLTSCNKGYCEGLE
ncbi:hypothetical protein F5Y14DRAFT_412214 [Nemania sp. NC0429]|nr:hypothetical protein F5Y14DRAFT_412214 [Nemania sp. NC0429]